MEDEEGKDENQAPVSEHFKLECAKNSEVKISHKYTLGSTDIQTFCVRYDPHDRYIGQGCNDGTIRIYNAFTGK